MHYDHWLFVNVIYLAQFNLALSKKYGSFTDCILCKKSGYVTLSSNEAPILKLWGVWSQPFIVITSKSTLTLSSSTCYGPIYESNLFEYYEYLKPL